MAENFYSSVQQPSIVAGELDDRRNPRLRCGKRRRGLAGTRGGMRAPGPASRFGSHFTASSGEVAPFIEGVTRGRGQALPIAGPQFPSLENEPEGALSVVAPNPKPRRSLQKPGCSPAPCTPPARSSSLSTPTHNLPQRALVGGRRGVASHRPAGSRGNSRQEGPKDPGKRGAGGLHEKVSGRQRDRGAVRVKETPPGPGVRRSLSPPPTPPSPDVRARPAEPRPWGQPALLGGEGKGRGGEGKRRRKRQLVRAAKSRLESAPPPHGDAARRHEVGLPLSSPPMAWFPGLEPGHAPSPLYKRAGGADGGFQTGEPAGCSSSTYC
ncbi:collagen alpha-1(I) chain-like [Dromiciops gliroides]|uniref:collagen alpha-1(I) chain-like n=1 Tax=Dromiciops gliroides TaxID=33562 RepID=UPI001CC3E96C|nr:collagen alpha-1(I) chain-like [Dromiciops gliroides]